MRQESNDNKRSCKIKDRQLAMKKQQFESQSLKLELERNHYMEEHEHLTVENEQLKALYEEFLKKKVL